MAYYLNILTLGLKLNGLLLGIVIPLLQHKSIDFIRDCLVTKETLGGGSQTLQDGFFTN